MEAYLWRVCYQRGLPRLVLLKIPNFHLGVTHEKFQKPETFRFFSPKVFHRKGLENG